MGGGVTQAGREGCRPKGRRYVSQMLRGRSARLGGLALGPENGQQQADDNSNRHFDETVGGDNPRRLGVRDEHHDG